ncbi:MAG TPA: CoB--CoM heterodisulfide reductase iron-sulfur subunit A family protein, partial [bacterium]|nr:CoB--CoM heterodisulfide reductase iron-sulfur subunit A family protein [bacterium]
MNIGGIFCSCRGEIDKNFNLEDIREYLEKQDDVKFTKVYHASCSINDQEDMFKEINENKIDALLFIGCSPKYYEKLFQDIFLKKTSINPGLIKFVNFREQLRWAHRDQEEKKIVEKAKFVLKAALEDIKNAKPIHTEKIPNLKSALVIGGGISGIHASLALANQGHHVYLIEKSPYLGGVQLQMSKTFPRDECSACAITPIINTLFRTPNIDIFTLSEVIRVRGRTGNYVVTIKQNPRFVKEICTNCHECINVCKNNVPDEYNFNFLERKVITLPRFDTFPKLPFISINDISYCRDECKAKLCTKVCDAKAIDLDEEPKEIEINAGGIIISIGYDIYQSTEYGYGKSKDILTLEEYERILVSTGVFNGDILRPSNRKPPKNIAFILCVGARQPNKIPYCSRYCCMATASAIKQTVEKLPDAKIYVFYRDIYALGKVGDEYIKETQNFPNVEWIRTVPEHFGLKSKEIEDELDVLTLKINVSGGKLDI